MDLGPPASYLTVEAGIAVFSSDGERIGAVEHVLADPDKDIFDGLVIDTRLGPGGHRFADAPLVDQIHERGVVLAVTSAEAESLPVPTEGPPALEVGPDDVVPEDLRDKLHRAWRLISGRY